MSSDNKKQQPWQNTIDKKREKLSSTIPTSYKLSPALLAQSEAGADVREIVAAAITTAEREISELSVLDLVNALAQGCLTSQEVLAAFFHRTAVAHQLVRCLSEVNIDAAQARAHELDRYWRQHRTPIGPLHGLPVSVMDRFHIAGLDSACGFVSWANNPKSSADEGSIIKTLQELGAIVFCKTAVPMSMMMGETTSNLIGTTVSPYNTHLSAGGACGGEGALIACRGSLIGVGTELAGSCRIPAAWNGLCALKCSEERLPMNGTATALAGLPTAAGAIGLLANDTRDLSFILRTLLAANATMTDPHLIELPWRQEMYDNIAARAGQAGRTNGRLCLGILSCDGHVQPHPTVSRAMHLVKSALLHAGHEVVDWQPPPHAAAVHHLFEIFGSTCMIDARRALDASGEPPVPQMQDWYDIGDRECSTAADFWRLHAARDSYRTLYAEYQQTVSDTTASGRLIDGVVLPVAPTTAVRPGDFRYFGYSAIANVLDYSAGTIPITVGDQAIDQKGVTPSFNAMDGHVQQTFRSSDIHGMPIGVQVMCTRLQEERVLALMQAIGEAIEDFSSLS